MKAWLELVRVRQWIKNVFCLAGLFFAQRLSDSHQVLLALKVMGLFCLASSAVYILNDAKDISSDRHHPWKKSRPLASGAIPLKLAIAVMLGLMTLVAWGAYVLNIAVLSCVLLYFVNNFFYTLWFKHWPIVDVLSISFGFILRLFAGIYVLDDVPTVWISLCTFFLTLVLGFSKRRAELYAVQTNPNESQARKVLKLYSLPYLDSLINSASTMTIIAYGLFSTSYDKNPNLIITLPVVYFAIMYYKRKIMMPSLSDDSSGEKPERLILRPAILCSVVAWIVLFYLASNQYISIVR